MRRNVWPSRNNAPSGAYSAASLGSARTFVSEAANAAANARDTSVPSRASASAGAITSSQPSVPCAACKACMPRTVPGTATAAPGAARGRKSSPANEALRAS